MEMEREINLLSCDELDAVVGGMMNDGRGQLDPKAPGAYVPFGPPGMGGRQLATDTFLLGCGIFLATIGL
jgi:hypothetical protein